MATANNDDVKSIAWRLRKLAKEMRTHIPSGAEQMSTLTGEEMLEFFLQAKKLSGELDSVAGTSDADEAFIDTLHNVALTADKATNGPWHTAEEGIPFGEDIQVHAAYHGKVPGAVVEVATMCQDGLADAEFLVVARRYLGAFAKVLIELATYDVKRDPHVTISMGKVRWYIEEALER